MGLAQMTQLTLAIYSYIVIQYMETEINARHSAKILEWYFCLDARRK
jgi:hypothetical protein